MRKRPRRIIRRRGYRPAFRSKRVTRRARNIRRAKGEYYRTIEESAVTDLDAGTAEVQQNLSFYPDQFPRSIQIADLFQEFRVKWAELTLKPNYPIEGNYKINVGDDVGQYISYYDWNGSNPAATSWNDATGRAYSRRHRVGYPMRRRIYPKATETKTFEANGGPNAVRVPINKWMEYTSASRNTVFRGLGIWMPQHVTEPSVTAEILYSVNWKVCFEFRNRKNGQGARVK